MLGVVFLILNNPPPQFPHTPHILPHYPNWHHLPHSLIYQSLIIHYLILARALIFN